MSSATPFANSVHQAAVTARQSAVKAADISRFTMKSFQGRPRPEGLALLPYRPCRCYELRCLSLKGACPPRMACMGADVQSVGDGPSPQDNPTFR
jgi:hypothetical protein